MSASGSKPSYVVHLKHSLIYCCDIAMCRSILSICFNEGIDVLFVSGGSQAAAQFPLDITGLTDTVIL